jgi:hypothetical protein
MERKTLSMKLSVAKAGKILRANQKGMVFLTEEGKSYLRNMVVEDVNESVKKGIARS